MTPRLCVNGLNGGRTDREGEKAYPECMSRIEKPLTLVRISSKGKTHKAGIEQKTSNTQIGVGELGKRSERKLGQRQRSFSRSLDGGTNSA